MEQSGHGFATRTGTDAGAPSLPAVSGPGQHRYAAAWSKVPEVTVLFWVTKVLTTGMGETTSDFLARVLGPVVAGALGLFGLVALLVMQFRATRYSPCVYWSAIVMVSVFGTMAADVAHVVVGIPYTVSTVVFSLALAAILTAWYVSERTLSIHSIRTPRREAFYWATVLATFALGTATGDLTAGTIHLGYLTSGVLFTALIAVPALAGRFLRLNPVAAFWAAYVLTRPLGASFADWMGVPARRSGLGWGTGPVSLVLAVLIAALVAYQAVAHRRTAVPVEARS
ncbi:COG4705 family protein [Streptomyces sp. H39-C1]|uniref:COG4705 family protein n=1 Tax=Streptomyces sp. H39-C1 TaxID=3004355 RepID=UPI003FA7DEA4